MKDKAQSISEKIKSLDIYGSKPEFKINSRQSFKTFFGSLLTIASITTTILALGYFSIQLFDVKNPKLVMSIRNIFSPPLIDLNNTNYGFAFGLQNPFTYDQFIDESVYRAEAFHMTGTRMHDRTFNWTSNKLDLETCTKEKFPTAYAKIFTGLPFISYYCLKDTGFQLSGTFLNEEYKYIMITLFECKNKTDDENDNNNLNNAVKCKPKSYIDEILAGTFFNFAHTDLTLDPTDYEDPNQLYAGDSYTTISNKFYKEMHHYLKLINFETDKGWLISDIKKQSYIQLDYIKEMTDFRKSENFLSYNVKLSTKLETYARSYSKMQNIAADSGGFLKMISIICFTCSYLYNKTKFYEFFGEEIMIESHKSFSAKSKFSVNLLPRNNAKKANFENDSNAVLNLNLNNKKMGIGLIRDNNKEQEACSNVTYDKININKFNFLDNVNRK